MSGGWKKFLKVFGITVSALTAIYVGLMVFVSLTLGPIVAKRVDASIVGELNSVRSAISIYYGDHNGQYPHSLQDLSPHYFPPNNVPTLWRTGRYSHPKTSDCLILERKDVHDTGKWAYIYNPGSPDNGLVFIDCNHKDRSGKRWCDY